MSTGKNKTMLIIRACGDSGEVEECINIKSQAGLYYIDITEECPATNEELYAALEKNQTYDYIYLSAHDDEQGFGNKSHSIDLDWMAFGTALCSSACMKEECIVLLSCCRGGLNQVAYDLFYCCLKIAYIVGPRQRLYPQDLLIGFNILLYNIERRGMDAVVACEKVKAGTDIRFVCFDRLETEADIDYLSHISTYGRITIEKVREAKLQANESLYVPPEVEHLINKAR